MINALGLLEVDGMVAAVDAADASTAVDGGSDPTDRYGKQMKMMAATVNDAELLDVLAYISSLGQP